MAFAPAINFLAPPRPLLGHCGTKCTPTISLLGKRAVWNLAPSRGPLFLLPPPHQLNFQARPGAGYSDPSRLGPVWLDECVAFTFPRGPPPYLLSPVQRCFGLDPGNLHFPLSLGKGQEVGVLFSFFEVGSSLLFSSISCSSPAPFLDTL